MNKPEPLTTNERIQLAIAYGGMLGANLYCYIQILTEIIK